MKCVIGEIVEEDVFLSNDNLSTEKSLGALRVMSHCEFTPQPRGSFFQG
jgi:hypothetical protein